MKTNIIIRCIIAVLLLCGNTAMSQDTIIKTNQSRMLVKVTEVRSDEVKYRLAENPTGPQYSINRNEIFHIHYANGMREVYNTTTNETTQVATNTKEPAQVDYTPTYIITLKDGSKLKGRIVRQNDKEVVFNDNNLGEKTIARKNVLLITTEFGEGIKVITLNDGSVISGKIINRSAQVVVIENTELGKVQIATSKIKTERDFEDANVTSEGKIWFKNPNSTRYLFAPSAYQLKKGEGYYQNICFLGNSANVGITDYATIGGGLVGPFGMYLNTKLGFKISENIHVAGGVLIGNSFPALADFNVSIGLGFGVVTLGNYDHNITFGAGYGVLNYGSKTKWMENPIYTFNGMARVSKKWAMVTENWMVTLQRGAFSTDPEGAKSTSRYNEVFWSGGFRYMAQRTTFDFGIVNNTENATKNGNYIGIPFVGMVVRFGNYKDE